ncbi:MAG: hypothetical protein NTY45_14200 [Elusimicrobia bacterium]|nr:hypothetical protein [Elusimicrobiota bacterium]
MIPVLMLFLIPVGGGIPAGVLLARSHALAWPVTAGLYFVSDVILALLFEPVLRLLILAGRKINFIARAAEIMRAAMSRTTAHYGGAGPFALIMIAFGVDPMTGRAAAAAAGHGFIAGWAIAIAGDMLYFGVVMAATLRLNSALGDPNRTMWVILAAMFLLPVVVRRFKAAYTRRGNLFCRSTIT